MPRVVYMLIASQGCSYYFVNAPSQHGEIGLFYCFSNSIAEVIASPLKADRMGFLSIRFPFVLSLQYYGPQQSQLCHRDVSLKSNDRTLLEMLVPEVGRLAI
jgi:hypothetical protein